MGWADGDGGGEDPGAIGCLCLLVLLALVAFEGGRLLVMVLSPLG